jgi:hypothetical protein
MDAARVEAAAKAAFPEFWSEDLEELKPQYKALVTIRRQEVIDKMVKGLESYEATRNPATVVLEPPDGAAMVQQVLVTTMFIDNDGRTAYTVRCLGEGLLNSWLGMGVMAQDYLLQRFRASGGWEQQS